MEALMYAVWALLELVIIGTAKVLVPLASNGKWRCDGLASRESRIHSGAGALSYEHNGQRFITDTGQLLIGVVFYAIVGSAAIYALT
ncbi:MAG: hypothetical protein J7556_14385 [Acidovorax sp.]|nr:hypothetical protein [Acidovorax sp.]